MPRSRAQFVLFDGFDPLDAVAPYEVLAAGSGFLGGALDIAFVSAEGPRDVVSGIPGITLSATAELDPSAPGYVVVPGASAPADGDPGEVDTIPALLARFATGAAPLLRECLDNDAVTVATVCGGSLALAMAGLLAGRTATTHVLGIEPLAAAGVTAIRARVVDDGDLVTAGGVTSGLDLGLYLLERDFGPRVAHAVEELFEYERRGTPWKNSGLTAAR
ncbi:DJ-1/PfpI family protein [Amycolatopsis sp. NPDC051102]|uniref:DJ-1/PfpI family protein n=1 Tax=Amycolatopsis sp. NPDC051102 TaxID=3155163 RepID=UPI00343C4C36